jgi:hypothetical protein
MRGDVWGGYKTLDRAAQYTPQDINGLKNLRANATKPPAPSALVGTVNDARIAETRQ